MENLTDYEDYVDWYLDQGLIGPVIAFIVALHLVLALPANLFVVVYSLCHRQDFKKGAVILLFCLAVSNLIMVLLYMPFVIVATAAGEWIIGSLDNTRHVLCQIHGFVYEYSITVSIHILVVISIERFMYIVKIHLHSKIMSWKVVTIIMVIVWVLPIFWCLFPYYGVGTYEWSLSSGGRLSFILHDSIPTTVIFILYSVMILAIIIVTTLWTFIFTRGFLKKNLKRRQDFQFSDQDNNDYNHRVRNLLGIFGALLAVNLFSWIAYAFSPVFYALVGDNVDIVPVEIDAILFIFSFSNTVANPVIQIYFRKDMREVIKMFFQMKRRKRDAASNLPRLNGSTMEATRKDKNVDTIADDSSNQSRVTISPSPA